MQGARAAFASLVAGGYSGGMGSDSTKLSRRAVFTVLAVAIGLPHCIFLALVLLAANAVINYRAMGLEYDSIPFNEAEWKAPASSKPSDMTRLAMLDDLLARHNFKGWTTAQVESLLGPPDDVDVDNDWLEAPDDWDMLYNTGMVMGDLYWLVFDLDEQDKVISYRKAND